MNYTLVNKSTQSVDNFAEWDGDTSTWQPPETHIAVPTATAICLEWMWSEDLKDFEQVEVVGFPQIGYLWDGQKFTQPEKPQPPVQPQVDGAQTL